MRLPVKQKTRSLTQVHVAVFLFGTAGLFGKFLDLPSPIIVLGRVSFAAIFLALVIAFSKNISFKLNRNIDYLQLALLGVILAFHWVAFFQSIQVSTVAIGLLSFSTFPVFTTFIEPLVFKEKLKGFDVVLALVTLFGVGLIIPKIDFSNSATQGVIWGVLSGALFAILSILNRRHVQQYSSITIAFYQNLSACVVLVPFVFICTYSLQIKDILLLVVLGVLFTAISHALFIEGMKHVKAQTASVIASLEPVYGIAGAVVFFSEVPSVRTIIGGTIVLAVALIASNRKSATT